MISACFLAFVMMVSACSDDAPKKGPEQEVDLAEQNLLRAMELTDHAVTAHFTGDGMAMARYYNPYTNSRSEEKGSVWMYTASIEAVTAILHALEAHKEHGNVSLYDQHFTKYADLLDRLIENADFYKGTFTLVSYTQTKQWSVYAVDRAGAKGAANVTGILNVYDDQMWLVRELIEAYKVTGKAAYLTKAETLTEYILDGWDATRNTDGTERGGIPWGPGYVTKHSCSNGPMVSPLVWLHELYKDKNDQIEHRYIDATDRVTRKTEQVKKSDYYLDFAKKIYAWQKSTLLRGDGVYDDMRGGCSPGSVQTENVGGVTYRRGGNCQDRVGPAYSYNSGSMLSGGVDLYRATSDAVYLTDLRNLSDASFNSFATLGSTRPGYYTYNINGFNNWFNGVLMRAFVEAHNDHEAAADYINTFQQNLDYGYENYLYNGFLPTNLLVGWSRTPANNRTEGMFNFTFAAEYAVLSRYELEK